MHNYVSSHVVPAVHSTTRIFALNVAWPYPIHSSTCTAAMDHQAHAIVVVHNGS